MAKPPPVEEMSLGQLKDTAALYRAAGQIRPSWARRLSLIEERIAKLEAKERMDKIETETGKPGFPWGDT